MAESTDKKRKNNNSDFAGWNMLSRVRNELFGLAILGIFVFHIVSSILDTKVKTGRAYKFAWIYDLLVSSTGVEIFVILSGVGLCYSFHKDGSLIRFYKRRLVRVVFPYFLFAVPFWIYADIILRKKKTTYAIKDLFFWTFVRDGKRTLWYVIFIIGMYIIYPVLFYLFTYRTGQEKSRRERRRLMILSAVMIVVYYAFMLFFKKHWPNFYKHTEIALLRVPVFIYGAWLGEKVYRKKMISLADILLPVAGVIMKMILVMDRADRKIDIERVFNGRLTAFLYSTALLLVAAVILDMLREKKLLNIPRKVIAEIGKTSFELYLSHIMIRHIFIIKYGSKGFVSRWFIYTLLSFAAAFLMRFICKILLSFIERLKDKKTENDASR